MVKMRTFCIVFIVSTPPHPSLDGKRGRGKRISITLWKGGGGVDEFFLEGRLDGKGEGQLFEGGFRAFRESNYNFYLTSVI